jgi:hypothetical protein
MNNHSYKIIVICNSDIILKGLAEILTGCNSDEIILLHQPNELIDYPHLSGYLLLILPYPIYGKNEAFLKRMFLNAKESKYLYLNEEQRDEPSKELINIYDNRN